MKKIISLLSSITLISSFSVPVISCAKKNIPPLTSLQLKNLIDKNIIITTDNNLKSAAFKTLLGQEDNIKTSDLNRLTIETDFNNKNSNADLISLKKTKIIIDNNQKYIALFDTYIIQPSVIKKINEIIKKPFTINVNADAIIQDPTARTLNLKQEFFQALVKTLTSTIKHNNYKQYSTVNQITLFKNMFTIDDKEINTWYNNLNNSWSTKNKPINMIPKIKANKQLFTYTITPKAMVNNNVVHNFTPVWFTKIHHNNFSISLKKEQTIDQLQTQITDALLLNNPLLNKTTLSNDKVKYVMKNPQNKLQLGSSNNDIVLWANGTNLQLTRQAKALKLNIVNENIKPYDQFYVNDIASDLKLRLGNNPTNAIRVHYESLTSTKARKDIFDQLLKTKTDFVNPNTGIQYNLDQYITELNGTLNSDAYNTIIAKITTGRAIRYQSFSIFNLSK